MGLFARWEGAVPSIAFTYVSDRLSGTGTISASGVSFGAAHPTRRIIVPVSWDNGTGGSLTSCTIGGVSATRVVRGTGFNGNSHIDIWIADVPTGTAGTLSFSGVSGNWSVFFAVFQALYLRSSAAVATDTDAVDALSMSVSVPARGIVVAAARVAAFGSVGTNSWSGMPRDFNESYLSNNVAFVGGSSSFSAATTETVTTSWSNASDDVGCMASFR